MLDQSVSEKSIRQLGYNTWIKFKSSEDSDYDSFVANTYTQIDKNLCLGDYDFTAFVQKTFKSKIGWEFACAADELVAKKLNDNIRRLFKVRPSDRHAIVKQTIALARDSQPITIARLDIKDFYESLDRESIIRFVTNEWLLSHQNRMALKKWNQQLAAQGVEGLPRGMSLSSTLSEIRIRHFDKAMKLDSNVYFYARYVDDIIVFYTGDKSELQKTMENKLSTSAKELSLNEEKSEYFELNVCGSAQSSEIDYLGYKLLVENNTRKPINRREVKVLISDKKITKIKSRVRKAFIAYARDRRFKLFLARLKFLSANQYIIGDIERTKLKSGIYYNYPLITDHSQLSELDAFYQKFISSSKDPAMTAMALVKNHGGNLNNQRLKQLETISFRFGFTKRVMNSFTNNINKKIKRCW